MDIHIYFHHSDNNIIFKLDDILKKLNIVITKENEMSGELDALTAQVQANNDAEQSAIVLLNGLAAKLAAAGTDPVKLADLTASLKTNTDALAAAIVANTPQA